MTPPIVVATTSQRSSWTSPTPGRRGSATTRPSGPRTPTCATSPRLELDARGLDPFAPLLDLLADAGGEHWTFHLDDGRTEVTTENRLRHITMGQNLATEYAVSCGASHMLFLAADLEPPADCLPKLLEVDHPMVGGEVSTYCLSGPDVDGYGFPVQAHMPTAAFVLIAREVFNRLRWRADGEAGMSDDPCYHHDAATLLGVEALVRKDCVGIHHPIRIGAIETRGHDMAVHR
jgi:hypothetical protein